ncbi:MAG: hypothetical protein OXH36_04675 [Bdellovibrionales bacterium]|nr:hypothetical protein [Bdellovibrionales bacterium]
MDEHKMYKYSVKSPTRVDLAGGLLDIWPVYALVPDCVVLNFSIPVFTSVQTENDVISAQTERQVVAFPSHEAGSHFGGFPSREKCHSRESGNPELFYFYSTYSFLCVFSGTNRARFLLSTGK